MGGRFLGGQRFEWLFELGVAWTGWLEVGGVKLVAVQSLWMMVLVGYDICGGLSW